MALFTDGPVSTIEDLTGQDSQLLDVARTEGVDLRRKLELAQEEIGLELSALLGRTVFAEQEFRLSAERSLANVAVTSALKLWHTFRTLEMVYRDAYHSQLNDRYAGKRDAFRGMAKWAYEKLVQLGIGIVSDPIAQATTPEVETAPGGLRSGTYYVTTAWINGAGEEGACGSPAVITTAGGTLRAHPGKAPGNATGWNIYVGDSGDTMTQQNGSPIPAGQSWTQPNTTATSGKAPSTGQKPNYTCCAARIIQRG